MLKQLHPCGRAIGALSLLLASLPAQAESEWTLVPLPPHPNDMNGGAASWVDFDDDGDLDLYISRWNLPNTLLRNDGGGDFVDVTTPELELVGYSRRAVWADYDNDGDKDLFVAQSDFNFDSPSTLLRNDGGMNFTDVSGTGPLALEDLLRGAAWADCDNDGLLDLYVSVTRGDSRNLLFRNLGNDQFVDIADEAAQAAGIGRGVEWCDYDNDGDMDIYVSNGAPGEAGQDFAKDRLVRNDGGGMFTDVTAMPIGEAVNGRGVAWGDYDNDGDFDLAIANANFTGGGGGAPNRIFRNDGGDVFTDVTPLTIGVGGANTRDVAWVNADNDADLDVAFSNVNGARLHLNDATSFAQADEPGLIATHGNAYAKCWGDFDLDGDLDVFISFKGAPNMLLRNDLDNDNHWIVIKLRGTISNRDAIGAQVRVTTGNRTQLRQVSAGSGYLSQHMLWPHFGLGDAAIIDRIEVRWPSSGLRTTLTNVAADAYIEIAEPDCPADLDANRVVDFHDLNVVLSSFLQSGVNVPGDINGDGAVDFDDLNWLLSDYSTPCAPQL